MKEEMKERAKNILLMLRKDLVAKSIVTSDH